MSRLPPALARRIDRLAGRAHAFHRLAHHPLCAPYGAEVIRLGRKVRVCRGCALTALGGGAGALLAALAPPAPAWAAWALALAFAAAALRAVRPRPAGPVRSKWATRALPMAAGAAAAVAGARAGGLAGWGAAAGAALAFGLAVRAYRRRGPDRAPCAACPEASRPGPCSGLAPAIRRERAFQRLAGRWIRAA